MIEKKFAVSYDPSAVGTRTFVYAVNPNAEYAIVETLQIANSSDSTREFDVGWVEDSKKVIDQDTSTYFGDGTIKVARYLYASALHIILEDAVLPTAAALKVIESPLYLSKRDAIAVRPSSSGSETSFKPLVVVTEYYLDDADSSTSVNLDDVNNLFLLNEY